MRRSCEVSRLSSGGEIAPCGSTASTNLESPDHYPGETADTTLSANMSVARAVAASESPTKVALRSILRQIANFGDFRIYYRPTYIGDWVCRKAGGA